MITTLKKLFPLGFVWKLPEGNITDLIEALAVEPERCADFLRGVVREMNPGTATDTQEEWFNQYGIAYSPTGTIESKQAVTLERYIALGDQDLVYVQDQVTKAGFDVTIVENLLPSGDATNECGPAECGVAECWGPGDLGEGWIFHYYVIGTIDTESEILRLAALLQRIAPGHLIPLDFINVSDNVCGPAICGVAFCDG